MPDIKFEKLWDGVYRIDNRLATENIARGEKVYGEELVDYNGSEYRLWNPYRSKLAAAIVNGLKTLNIKNGSDVLYVGAATGTTASHVSDIVGEDGTVYCIELSERNMRQLVKVCEKRPNMLPILGDARYPEKYSDVVDECNVLYQDVSAREQAYILNQNERFLKAGGTAYFVIKSQSVDVGRSPADVFRQELNNVNKDLRLVEKVGIEPFDRLHMFSVFVKDWGRVK